MPKVLNTERAERDIKRLDPFIRDRIEQASDELAAGKKKPEGALKGKYQGLFKLRVGDYRIFLKLDKPDTYHVFFIRHRGNGY